MNLRVVDMLEKAFGKIPDNANLILHKDRGQIKMNESCTIQSSFSSCLIHTPKNVQFFWSMVQYLRKITTGRFIKK